MLTAIREACGATQSELAAAAGLSQSTISKYEAGLVCPSAAEIDALAVALHVRPSFFSAQATPSENSTIIFHRKRKALSERHLRKIHAQVDIFRFHIKRLLSSVEIDARNRLKELSFGSGSCGPSDLAKLVRRSWKLELGPIESVVGLIEDAGGIVVPFDFGTDRIDALSEWPIGMPPLFFCNINMPWDRIRFSLAHELGHVLMHESGVAHDAESEADEFAAELLLPESSVTVDFIRPLTIAHLARMKAKWKTSIQALLRRALQVGFIDERKYTSMNVQISQAGYRKKEPVAIAAEQPRTMEEIVEFHMNDLDYTTEDVSMLLHLPEDTFRKIYLKNGGDDGSSRIIAFPGYVSSERTRPTVQQKIIGLFADR